MLLGLLASSLLSPFFLDVTADVRSAYITRGKVIEDRPMQITHIRPGWDTGVIGKFGYRGWLVSSLTDRRSEVHRRAFYETDSGIFWNYAWKIDEDGRWRFVTEVLKNWMKFNGYTAAAHAKGSDDSIDEWRFGNALENPYVTPYWLHRRGIREKDWSYYQVGLRKKFPLSESVSLTLDYQVDFGNRRHMLVRYGGFRDGTSYSNDIQSSTVFVTLGWQVTDWCELRAGVHQFDLLSSKARRACDDHKANFGHKDLTVGVISCRLRF